MKKLEAGKTYVFGAFNQEFTVIATHKSLAWVEWQDGTTQEVDIVMDELVTEKEG